MPERMSSSKWLQSRDKALREPYLHNQPFSADIRDLCNPQDKCSWRRGISYSIQYAFNTNNSQKYEEIFQRAASNTVYTKQCLLNWWKNLNNFSLLYLPVGTILIHTGGSIGTLWVMAEVELLTVGTRVALWTQTGVVSSPFRAWDAWAALSILANVWICGTSVSLGAVGSWPSQDTITSDKRMQRNTRYEQITFRGLHFLESLPHRMSWMRSTQVPPFWHWLFPMQSPMFLSQNAPVNPKRRGMIIHAHM